MDRTYRVTHHCNTNKLQQVVLTIKVYRVTAEVIGSEQWKCFLKNRFFDKNLNIKHLSSALCSRYKQTCQYKVVGILNSFVSNRQNEYQDKDYGD